MRKLLPVSAVVWMLFATACGSSTGNHNASNTGAGGASGQSAGLTSVKVDVIPVIDVAPLYLGYEKGIFAKHGIKLKLNVVQTGAAAAAAVISGEDQFGFAAPVPEIQAQAQGLPLVVVANAISQGKGLDQAIVAKAGSSMSSAKDLNGKIVAVNALRAVNELVVRAVVDKQGGDAKSLKFIALPYPDMQSALASGRIDAAYLIEPFLSAGVAAGDKVVIANPQEAWVGPQTTYSSYFAKASYINDNPTVVKNFVAAVNEANTYADAHPNEVRSIIATYTNISASITSKIQIGNYATGLDTHTYTVMSQEMVNLGWIKSYPNLTTLLYKSP